ncbi:MAG: di-heme oxidoredictase family protein, partial [Planctomycetota bacterium]|nr:di-heme oxidoredictase family protein [Planctomycetota bacterium]
MSGFVLAMAIGQVELQPRMGDPISGLDAAYTARFEAGAQLYSTSLIAEDGLGPIFNKQSCANCHNNPVGGHGSQTVIRFGMEDKKEGFIELEEYGGSLLQVSGIDLACAEELPSMANIVADRLTIGMLGYGLVEAISDADLLALESSGPGVSGRANIVPLLEDPTTTRVGRFGWKSQLATILSFSGDAAREEMGLTNRLIPTENDPNGILPPAISECDTVPDPEDGPDAEGFHFIDRVSDFQRFLAAPPQTPRSGMRGEQLFTQVGCAQCHNPSFTTANDPSLEPFLRNKAIRPYSNFLLHNMGLASDFIAQDGAGQYEMRTPPLWGLRTRRPMWHDGRISEGTFTDLITDAIAEHNALLSEGVASAQAYDALPSQDKADVIAFLGSLGRAEFDMNGDES